MMYEVFVNLPVEVRFFLAFMVLVALSAVAAGLIDAYRRRDEDDK